MRQNFAKAAQIKQAGGCTTTAYATTVGLGKDPTISIRVEVLRSWLETLGRQEIPMEGICRAWERISEIVAGPSRWSKVRGPMGAVIATLQDLNWRPVQPTVWEDQNGLRWEINPR